MQAPSEAGYVYFEGRSVKRIQRNKPACRLTLTCYKHPKCNLLINLDRAPPDEELKKWFFEQDAAPPGSDKATAVEIGRRHLQTARGRWIKRK